MNIYVGNLSFEISAENLRQAFEGFDQVISARIVKVNIVASLEGLVLSKCLTRQEPKRPLIT